MAPAPWFLVRTRNLIHALLYDEAAVQRWLTVGCAATYALVKSGGVVPTTEFVVPLPAWLTPARGDLFGLAALFFASGGLPEFVRKFLPTAPEKKP